MTRILQTYLLSLILISTNAIGQTTFNLLIKDVKSTTLPYKSESGQYEQKILHSLDSIFIIHKLKKIQPMRVNPYGGTAFGNLDCNDTSDCLNLADIGQISILCSLKINDTHYLLHIELAAKEQYGMSRYVLISITTKGEIISWIFSNGATGNLGQHGNIDRDLTITANKEIKITETSWGDNTETYNFDATFIIAQEKDNNYTDIKNGEFELKELCIHY